MERDSDVREIPGESAAAEGGGGRDEAWLSQGMRAADEARTRGKKRCASNDDDADSDTAELANTPIQHACERRMASLLDGTMSADEYNAPEEMRAYQGALRASGKVEPASASDNWAQKGLSGEILVYNERRALARAKSREAYESAEKVIEWQIAQRRRELSL